MTDNQKWKNEHWFKALKLQFDMQVPVSFKIYQCAVLCMLGGVMVGSLI